MEPTSNFTKMIFHQNDLFWEPGGKLPSFLMISSAPSTNFSFCIVWKPFLWRQTQKNMKNPLFLLRISRLCILSRPKAYHIGKSYMGEPNSAWRIFLSRLVSRLDSLDAKITLGIQFSLFTEVIRLKSRYLGTPNYPWGTPKSDGHAPEPRSKSSKSYGYAPRSSPEISQIGVWKFRIQVLYGVLMLSECV